jgi:hypothetical protein
MRQRTLRECLQGLAQAPAATQTPPPVAT